MNMPRLEVNANSCSRVTIVTYHYVRPIAGSAWPGIKGLELEQFRQQLDHIQRYYTSVSMEQIIASCHGGPPLPDNAISLTFDDGYTDHWQYVFPELLRRKMHGAFYAAGQSLLDRKLMDVNKVHYVLAACPDHTQLVRQLDGLAGETQSPADMLRHHETVMFPSRWDGAETAYVKRMLQYVLPAQTRARIASALFRDHVSADEEDFAEQTYLTVAQAREMIDGGMHFGSHGEAHIWLGRSSVEEQRADIESSLRILGALKQPLSRFSFCYPYGSYNDHTIGILRDLHCAVALTTHVGVAEVSMEKSFELSRIDATAKLPVPA